MTGNKQLKYGAILSYASIVLNIVAGLIYTPWMVAQIGQSDYGLYTLANSVITLFLIDFGLSTAASKYITQYLAENNQEKVNQFLGTIYKLYLTIDFVILTTFLVFYCFIGEIYSNLSYAEINKFKVVFAIAATFAVVNFPFITFNGILNSYEKFVPLKLADVIYRILVIALTIAGLMMGCGVYALVAVQAIVGLLVILYKYIAIKREIPAVKVNWRGSEKSLYKTIFTFSIWSTIFTLSQRLIFNITPSILGVVANSAEIAIFGVISTIEGYSYTITNAINGMFLPKISRIFVSERATAELNSLLQKVGRFQFILNGLIVVGFAVCGKQFITLWMGEAYIQAYYGILLVLVPGLFYNSVHIAETALVVSNRIKYSAIVNVCIGVLNVGLSWLFSAVFGAVGACLSIFVAYTVRAVVMNIIYWRVLQIDIKTFAKLCYIRMGVCVIISIVVGAAASGLLPNAGWLSLVCRCTLVCIVYCLAVFGIGSNKEERSELIRALRTQIAK